MSACQQPQRAAHVSILRYSVTSCSSLASTPTPAGRPPGGIAPEGLPGLCKHPGRRRAAGGRRQELAPPLAGRRLLDRARCNLIRFQCMLGGA